MKSSALSSAADCERVYASTVSIGVSVGSSGSSGCAEALTTRLVGQVYRQVGERKRTLSGAPGRNARDMLREICNFRTNRKGIWKERSSLFSP